MPRLEAILPPAEAVTYLANLAVAVSLGKLASLTELDIYTLFERHAEYNQLADRAECDTAVE